MRIIVYGNGLVRIFNYNEDFHVWSVLNLIFASKLTAYFVEYPCKRLQRNNIVHVYFRTKISGTTKLGSTMLMMNNFCEMVHLRPVRWLNFDQEAFTIMTSQPHPGKIYWNISIMLEIWNLMHMYWYICGFRKYTF